MTTTTSERPKPRLIRGARKVEIVQGRNPLMGAAEAARALGVQQSNLRELSGLPKPFMKLAMGSVWLSDDILKYREDRKRNPPRPGPKPKAKIAA